MKDFLNLVRLLIGVLFIFSCAFFGGIFQAAKDGPPANTLDLAQVFDFSDIAQAYNDPEQYALNRRLEGAQNMQNLPNAIMPYGWTLVIVSIGTAFVAMLIIFLQPFGGGERRVPRRSASFAFAATVMTAFMATVFVMWYMGW